MRLALNNAVSFIIKIPQLNFIFLNTLFLVTTLQLVSFNPKDLNILPLLKLTIHGKSQALSITSKLGHFQYASFSQLGQITAKSPSSTTRILTFSSKTRELGNTKVTSSFEILKNLNALNHQEMTFSTPKKVFSLTSSPSVKVLRPLAGKGHSDAEMHKNNIVYNPLFSLSEKFAPVFPQLGKTKFKDRPLLKSNPENSFLETWIEKLKQYDQTKVQDLLFAEAFKKTIQDLRFLTVLSSPYDPETKDLALRDLSTEFFWTLEGYVGQMNDKKTAFNPATGRFNQDICYDLYMPVADFFKTHRVLSCSPGDLCDFIEERGYGK